MKIRKYILFAVLLFIFPFIVYAKEPTDKMFVEIHIQENGDIKVKELAALSGSYQGRIRNILYQNPTATPFTGIDRDFEGSSLYNGSGITIDKVADVKMEESLTFASMNQLNQIYSAVLDAREGDYQVYQQIENGNGVDLKIYNPSSMHTAFYIEYTIQNAVVVHNDIAELAWNVLGDSYEENIGLFKIRVFLPGEDEDYRVWLKGPLNGEVERTTKSEANATYNFLGAYNPVTIRIMFDKNLVPFASKMSGIDGKNQILAAEKKAADLANQERNKIRMQNTILIGSTVLCVLGTIILFIFLLVSWKKNRKSNFQQDYFRDFPSTYGPEVLEYLLTEKISEKSFSALILSLVEKKALTVEEDKSKKKKDYILTLTEENSSLSVLEKKVLEILITKVGNGKSVSLNGLKNYGNNLTDAEDFMSEYRTFQRLAKENGKKEQFFKNAPAIKMITILFASLSIVPVFLLFSLSTIIPILLLIFLIFIIVITSTRKFYTEKGREDYAKWQAFKHFLEDFSTFDEKELPEVPLWNQYLIYATILGCAETLQKQMKIKLDTMDKEIYSTYDPFLWDHIYLHTTLTHVVNESVHNAVASSRSSIASSQNSSSGGYGGGASFGGGSFGGGGGGGRF